MLCGVITLVAPVQVNLSMAHYLFVLLYYGVAGVRQRSDGVRPRAYRAPLEAALQHENLATGRRRKLRR